MLSLKFCLTTAAAFTSLAHGRISEPPLLTNTIPTSWITTSGLTIASDAWGWQQYLISDGFSGVPSSEFSTCSNDYVGKFLDWASVHTSNWVTYDTSTTTQTISNTQSTYTTTQTLRYYQPLGMGMGGFRYQYQPPCCGYCQVFAPSVKLYYWQNLTSPNETITTTAVIEDQFTVTYPSAFLLFTNVYTEDRCTYNSTFTTSLGYEMNTDSMSYMLQGIRTSYSPGGAGNLGYTALPFNYWEQSSLCSSMVAQGSSSGNYLHTIISNTKYGFLPCYPAISAPEALFSAVPGWENCAERDIWYRGSYDPPHTLTPQPSIAPTTPAAPVSQPTHPSAPQTAAPAPTTTKKPENHPPGSAQIPSALPVITSPNNPPENQNTKPNNPLGDDSTKTSVAVGSGAGPVLQPQHSSMNAAPQPIAGQPPSDPSIPNNDQPSTVQPVVNSQSQLHASPSSSTTDESGVGGVIISEWTAGGGVTATSVAVPISTFIATGAGSKGVHLSQIAWLAVLAFLVVVAL